MRAAGLVVADALAAMRAACVPGTSTHDLDEIARDVLRKAGAGSNFLNYDIGVGPVSRGHLCLRERLGRPRHPVDEGRPARG